MLTEIRVDHIIQPLKNQFERDFGLVADWGYGVVEDQSGKREIYIRITTNADLSSSDVRSIREQLRTTLRENPETKEYFPFVQFNANSQQAD